VATSRNRVCLSRWESGRLCFPIVFLCTYSPHKKVFVSLVSVYVRKRYFTKNLNLVVRSEFERTNTKALTRARTTSIQRSAVHDINDPGLHTMAPSSLVIRRVDTEPRPIHSTDFGGTPFSYIPPHRTPVLRLGEETNQHGIHREPSLASAVSIHQTPPGQHLHLSQCPYINCR
jgi:hypothetical protein